MMLLIHLHCFKLQAQRPRIEEDKKFSNTPPEQESRNLQDTNFFIKYKNGISISILLANNQEHTSQTKILLKQQQSNHKTLWSIIWSKHNTTPPKPRICSSKATKLVLKMVTNLSKIKLIRQKGSGVWLPNEPTIGVQDNNNNNNRGNNMLERLMIAAVNNFPTMRKK